MRRAPRDRRARRALRRRVLDARLALEEFAAGALLLPAALSGTIALAACAERPPSAAQVSIDTLPSGLVHVRNPDPTLLTADRAPRADEIARIGVFEGDEAYVFGRIHDVLLHEDGRVYVLDSQARQIRIFDAAGTHVRTIGGRGSGPGELLDVRGMAWHPDGTLWVLDFPGNRRFTVFTADGDLVATYPREILSFGFIWDGAFDAAGRLYDSAIHNPDPTSPPGSATLRHLYIRHEILADALVPTDTFELPTQRSEPSFRIVHPALADLPQFIAIPFAPRLRWVFDGRDSFWAGTGESYRIWQQSLAGDTLRIVEIARPPSPVTSAERARERQRIEESVRSRGGDPRQIDFSRIPEHRPAFTALAVDAAGRLWVAQSPPPTDDGRPPGNTTFDILAASGHHLGELTLDVSAGRALAFAGDRVAGVLVDELDVERVVIYRLVISE